MNITVNCKGCNRILIKLNNKLIGVKDRKEAINGYCSNCISDRKKEIRLIRQYKALKNKYLEEGKR